MGLQSADFDYIRHLVLERSAILLESGKEYLVESRLMPLAKNEGLSSIQDLVTRLRTEPGNGLQDKVVEAMTTNETSFFRDLAPFEALKKGVLPKLAADLQNQRELNIWCGASSSGQEPYSLAILIKENFPHLMNWKIQFIASDISPEMIRRSREGVYSQLEINRGLAAPLLVKYFTRNGMGWQISEDLRRMIDFRLINLSEHWPPMPKMDLILLRNVLIYFDVDMKKSILGKIKKLLKPDGYLFLGAAETTLNLDNEFERINFDRSGCYRLTKK